MDSYVQNTLQINEEVLIQPKIHWSIYVDIYFSLSILYIVFCGLIHPFTILGFNLGYFFTASQKIIGLIIFFRILYLFVRNFSIEMAVTNYRVVYKIGILNIQTEELSNGKIESVSVRQSIMGRLLNYGDILFSGTGTSKLVFKKVCVPWMVKAAAEDIIRQSYAESIQQQPYNSYMQPPFLRDRF